MAIIENVEIWYLRADPARPNAKFNPENPSWEVQIRTYSLEQKKEWEALGIQAKLVVYPAGHDNEGTVMLDEFGRKVWKTTLSKKIRTKEGKPSGLIEVVDCNNQPLNPNNVGNGSIANIKVSQFDFIDAKGKPGVVNILMGLQVKKMKWYVAPPREEFSKSGETEIIMPEGMTPTEPQGEAPEGASAPKMSPPPPVTADKRAPSEF